MREPAFWWSKAGIAASLLAPIGLIYGAVAARRMAAKGTAAGVPVLCIGNYTLGGAGKTPTVIALARMLADAGERPFCLMRGYGGTLTGPKLVDLHNDLAAHVGDEALLLAHVAPTVVARDRVAGAAIARTQGASLIIMDDGLQNASLAKDFTLAVIDARRGVGNRCIFPAGPLRAPLAPQFAQTDALLVVGEGHGADDVVMLAHARNLPVLRGRLAPDVSAVASLKGRRVLAFAGIGDPDKFFATAEAAGIAVAERRPFDDHYRYTAEDAAELIMDAEHSGLALLTTEKDRARMAGERLLEALFTRAHALPVTMMFDEADELRRLLKARLRR
ncbi:MAG TPA: tetraacyldisaccharide 4'-kinase [Pseudolabrys sp.]|jgi:tetraacyldisaccharide 4'-kinase|nr:tetraacyldisaccharide 4'-kinase [Pseudolabrys sp.]